MLIGCCATVCQLCYRQHLIGLAVLSKAATNVFACLSPSVSVCIRVCLHIRIRRTRVSYGGSVPRRGIAGDCVLSKFTWDTDCHVIFRRSRWTHTDSVQEPVSMKSLCLLGAFGIVSCFLFLVLLFRSSRSAGYIAVSGYGFGYLFLDR